MINPVWFTVVRQLMSSCSYKGNKFSVHINAARSERRRKHALRSLRGRDHAQLHRERDGQERRDAGPHRQHQVRDTDTRILCLAVAVFVMSLNIEHYDTRRQQNEVWIETSPTAVLSLSSKKIHMYFKIRMKIQSCGSGVTAVLVPKSISLITSALAGLALSPTCVYVGGVERVDGWLAVCMFPRSMGGMRNEWCHSRTGGRGGEGGVKHVTWSQTMANYSQFVILLYIMYHYPLSSGN